MRLFYKVSIGNSVSINGLTFMTSVLTDMQSEKVMEKYRNSNVQAYRSNLTDSEFQILFLEKKDMSVLFKSWGQPLKSDSV